MDKNEATLVGGIAMIIPALWVVAYLFHVLPDENPDSYWWGAPWAFTVIALGFGLVAVGAVTGYCLGKEVR